MWWWGEVCDGVGGKECVMWWWGEVCDVVVGRSV